MYHTFDAKEDARNSDALRARIANGYEHACRAVGELPPTHRLVMHEVDWEREAYGPMKRVSMLGAGWAGTD